MIVFPPYPISVKVEGLGDAMVVYVKDNGMHENDEICVALMDGGRWYHVTTDKVYSWHNETYSIKKINQ